MSSKKGHTHPGTRDSRTGRFVPPSEANRRPATTQRERIPNPGYGDTGRKKKDDGSGTGSTGPRTSGKR